MLIKPDYRSEGELAINIRKATSIEETAPKRKHVRSCIVYTWDHKSSGAFWAGMKVLVLFSFSSYSKEALPACCGTTPFRVSGQGT
jgi:ANTH domain-containing protein